MTSPRRSWQLLASVGFAVGFVGLPYGALALEAGLPPWLILLLAASVLSASAELLFVTALAAGAAPTVAAISAVLVNVRNSVYGVTAARILKPGWQRLAGVHFVNDETVAYAVAQPEVAARRRAYWLLGLTMLVTWPVGAALGIALGRVVADPSVLGLDAVFPALVVALLFNAVRTRAMLLTVLCGAVIAVLTAPFLPAGLAPIAALAALAVPVARWLPDRPDRDADDER